MFQTNISHKICFLDLLSWVSILLFNVQEYNHLCSGIVYCPGWFSRLYALVILRSLLDLGSKGIQLMMM